MTNEKAIEYFKSRYERSKDYYDPHWEGQEYREHREYVEALSIAIKCIEREIEAEGVFKRP